MFKTLAIQPENGFWRVSADTKTWAAALFLRFSALDPATELTENTEKPYG